MDHQDAEFSDVVVVLVDEPGMTKQDAVSKLQAAGLTVSDVDNDNGVVEGTIESAKMKSLEKLPFVKYVRDVFNYVADFPPGDPRNQNPPNQEEELGDVDDAGA